MQCDWALFMFTYLIIIPYGMNITTDVIDRCVTTLLVVTIVL